MYGHEIFATPNLTGTEVLTRPVFVKITEPVLNRLSASGAPQVNKDGSLRKAGQGYRPSDPAVFVRNLESAGFRLEKFHLNRTGRRAILQASFPGPQNGSEPGYLDYVRILLDHTGRGSDRLEIGAVRCVCTNQFTTESLGIPHFGEEHEDWIRHPAEWALRERGRASQAVKRLEALRPVPGGGNLLLSLWGPFPGLYKRVWKHWILGEGGSGYFVGDTLWGALQAMTATRSPRLIQLAGVALGEGYEDLCAGRIPAAWRLPAPTIQ